MNPIHILLQNVHSYSNAGDAVATDVALEQLRQYFQGCLITIMMDDPPSYPGAEPVVISLSHWVKMSRHWRMLRLAKAVISTLVYVLSYRRSGKPLDMLGSPELTVSLAALVRSDLVVCTPGGYIRSSGFGTTLFMITWMMFLALLAGKPLYYLPQSFGPLKRRWEVWIIRNLLSRARLVMAREPLSYQNLLDWGIPAERCRLFPDLAFAFDSDPAEQGRLWLRLMGVDPQADQPFLGVTVMNWGAQNRSFAGQPQYERAVAAAIRDFVRRTQGKVFLLPQCWGPSTIEDDRIPARRVAKLISDVGDAVILVERPLPPARLKTVIGLMDVFLGTRTHSVIFCLDQNVPLLAVKTDRITESLAQMAGIQEWVVDINRISEKSLISQMQAQWSEREDIRKLIMVNTPEFRQQASHICDLLASDFASLQDRIAAS